MKQANTISEEFYHLTDMHLHITSSYHPRKLMDYLVARIEEWKTVSQSMQMKVRTGLDYEMA